MRSDDAPPLSSDPPDAGHVLHAALHVLRHRARLGGAAAVVRNACERGAGRQMLRAKAEGTLQCGRNHPAPAQHQLSASSASHAHDVGHGVHKDLAIANLACREAAARTEQLASAEAQNETLALQYAHAYPPTGMC